MSLRGVPPEAGRRSNLVNFDGIATVPSLCSGTSQ
jgi:hypothetical protein